MAFISQKGKLPAETSFFFLRGLFFRFILLAFFRFFFAATTLSFYLTNFLQFHVILFLFLFKRKKHKNM